MIPAELATWDLDLPSRTRRVCSSQHPPGIGTRFWHQASVHQAWYPPDHPRSPPSSAFGRLPSFLVPSWQHPTSPGWGHVGMKGPDFTAVPTGEGGAQARKVLTIPLLPRVPVPDDYHTHTTVMMYRPDKECETVRTPPFLNGGYAWYLNIKRIFTILIFPRIFIRTPLCFC